MLTLREATERALERAALSEAESEALFGSVFGGNAEPVALAGFLVALRAKGESADEIAGAAKAMRAAAVKPAGDFAGAIDTCGTGGDGKGGFNLSTAAALVACAAGARIAKHGNRSVSSKSGSADLLEALGMKIDGGPEAAGALFEKTGFTFFFAPNYHPATRHAAPVRKALGLRTIFNLLGPLTNPAAVERQLIGVYSPDLLGRYRDAARRVGIARAVIVHGAGHDEIAGHAATSAYELCDGHTTEYEITPEVAELPRVAEAALAGGNAAENAARLRALLEGGADPILPAILLNAAYALVIAGVADGACTGAKLAAAAVKSGAARAKLADIVRESNGGAA